MGDRPAALAAMDDQSVAQRILDHIANGTTDRGEQVWHEPVVNYSDPQRLAAELAMFRRFPTAFCPSAALAGEGSFVSRTAAGTPLIAVRGTDGVVRGFRNACRHRGMTVAQGNGRQRSFVCRYHGWTYGLDGGLRLVPHEDGFPGLEKSVNGLVPVHTVEQMGMVWITQDSPACQDDSLAGLPALLTDRQQIFDTREVDIEVNWKLLLEGFIEGYHIRSTHPKTFLPYGFDNLNVIDLFGRCSRVTYPFQRIRKLTDVPAHQRRVEGLLTYVYHLFPNVLVTKLSHHCVLVVLEPLSESRTRQHTWLMTNDLGEAALADARRDAEFVDEAVINEDREVITAIQRGLQSKANRVFTFGQFESAIVHFYRNLTPLLA